MIDQTRYRLPVALTAALMMLSAPGNADSGGTDAGAKADSRIAAADESAYEQALEAATAAQKEVAALGFEWTTVEALLQGAAAAAEAGEYGKATELATEARLHSELGIAQAQAQARQWKSAVVR